MSFNVGDTIISKRILVSTAPKVVARKGTNYWGDTYYIIKNIKKDGTVSEKGRSLYGDEIRCFTKMDDMLPKFRFKAGDIVRSVRTNKRVMVRKVEDTGSGYYGLSDESNFKAMKRTVHKSYVEREYALYVVQTARW